jgi:hypothetical protein
MKTDWPIVAAFVFAFVAFEVWRDNRRAPGARRDVTPRGPVRGRTSPTAYLPVAFFSALLLWYSTFLPERASRTGSAVLTIPLLSLKTTTCSFPASSL